MRNGLAYARARAGDDRDLALKSSAIGPVAAVRSFSHTKVSRRITTSRAEMSADAFVLRIEKPILAGGTRPPGALPRDAASPPNFFPAPAAKIAIAFGEVDPPLRLKDVDRPLRIAHRDLPWIPATTSPRGAIMG
jgi:hypothetical protein